MVKRFLLMFNKFIGSQFGKPRGIAGKISCFVMNIINRAMYKNIIKYIKCEMASVSGNKNIKILDIGYGNGYLIQQIYKNSKADITGIDISEDMRKAAVKRNYKGIYAGKISLKTGNCCNLQFKDNTFDIITSIITRSMVKFMQGVKQ